MLLCQGKGEEMVLRHSRPWGSSGGVEGFRWEGVRGVPLTQCLSRVCMGMTTSALRTING
jgi:hypothetical protein